MKELRKAKTLRRTRSVNQEGTWATALDTHSAWPTSRFLPIDHAAYPETQQGMAVARSIATGGLDNVFLERFWPTVGGITSPVYTAVPYLDSTDSWVADLRSQPAPINIFRKPEPRRTGP